MKFFLFYCWFLSFAIGQKIKRNVWFQYVDDYGNPVPGNTYIPQVYQPHTIPYYPPNHWPVHDNSANNNILTHQVFRSPAVKPHAQHSQSENVGDPYRPCSEYEFQCMSPKQCIPITKLCNNYLDCVDASDEVNCMCTSRLKQEKLCDFHDDCPNGEDELGCFGCGVNEYSCYQNETEYEDSGSLKQCYNSNQKCDQIFQCSNEKDERSCFLILKEIDSLVPTTENGVLYYLSQGQLNPVCVDDIGSSITVCKTMLSNFRGVQMKYESTKYNRTYVNVEFKHDVRSTTFVNNCPGRRFNSGNVILRVNCSSESSCGQPVAGDKNFSRIAGGYEAIAGSNPWLVGLFVNGVFRCGGNIISKTWILTAAHCLHIDGKPLSMSYYVEVRGGIQRLFSFSSNEQAVRVARGMIHGEYNKRTYENDIALLELESALAFNRFVHPICLPTEAHIGHIPNKSWIWGPEYGTVCKIAGWGGHTQHGPFPVDRQMELNVPIVSTCEPNNTKVICAGYEEGVFDACVGDSGSPLVCESKADGCTLYLAGIVSSGYNPMVDASHETKCGEKGWYGTYTRLTRYIYWIENTQAKMAQNETNGIHFRQRCPGVICSALPNHCAVRDGIVGCIDGQDERPKRN